MRKRIGCFGIGVLVGALASHSALAATEVSPPKSADHLAARYGALREQLASADYARREAGQKQLDALGPAQLEDLRRLAEAETDAEVKARVENRVAALEVYVLTHPKPLTLDVRDMPLSEVATELNRQLGGSSVMVTGNPGRFTLRAVDEPFWKIILDLQRQNEFAIATTSMTLADVKGTQMRVRLTQGMRQEYHLFDTFLGRWQVTGRPATGTWGLQLTMMSDPRVCVVGYGALRLDKITDQDGRNMLPLVLPGGTSGSSVLRSTPTWSSRVSLGSAPGLTRIRELRGGMPIQVLEKEGSVTLDLAEEGLAFSAPRGRFSVVKAGEAVQLKVAAPEREAGGAARPAGALTLRVFDKDGRVTRLMTTTITQGSLTLSQPNVAISKVEITWPETWREVVLPVEIRDLPVPEAQPVVRPEIRLAPLPQAQ